MKCKWGRGCCDLWACDCRRICPFAVNARPRLQTDAIQDIWRTTNFKSFYSQYAIDGDVRINMAVLTRTCLQHMIWREEEGEMCKDCENLFRLKLKREHVTRRVMWHCKVFSVLFYFFSSSPQDRMFNFKIYFYWMKRISLSIADSRAMFFLYFLFQGNNYWRKSSSKYNCTIGTLRGSNRFRGIEKTKFDGFNLFWILCMILLLFVIMLEVDGLKEEAESLLPSYSSSYSMPQLFE